MSAVAELINQRCPNGVEYKTLGDVVEIEKGTQLNRDSLSEEGEYPVINGGINPSGYWDEYNFEGDLITVSQGGASAGYVNWITSRFWAGAHCFVLTNPSNIVLYRYVYYVVKAAERELMQSQIGAGIPSVSVAKLSGIVIPVPPLPVQQEIVRRLDAMTGLIEDLEKELAARQKQYEWVREETFKQLEAEGVERKRLGEVSVIKNGKDYKAFGDGPYPVYGSGGIMTYVDRFAYDKPSVLIPRKGSIENLFYVESPFWNVDTIFYTEVNNQVVVPKYLYYSLQTVDLKRLNNAGGVPSLTQTGLYTLVVPVPPISVQQRIVRRLDEMTELIAVIEKEIALRKQQYEYCRERLLTFSRAG